MNDDHDMTRHLPNAEAMPADFEQTEALPTLVDGVSEQASAVTQALPVEPTQALPVEPTQTLPVAETEAMPVEKVAVPQTETKSLPVDSASTEKLSAEPLAAGAVSDESAAPVDDGQTETEPAADAFGSPAAASDRRTGDVPAGELATLAVTVAMFLTKGSLLPQRHPQTRAPRNSLMPPRPSPRVIQSSPVRHLSRFRCTARSPRESMTDTDRTARMRVLHTPLRPVPGSSRARAPITCKCRGTCRCVRSSARQGRAPPH